jgi:hypothetical protein
LSQLRVFASLSDENLEKYFSTENEYYRTNFKDVASVPAVVKYAQSVSQLEPIKDDRVTKKLTTGKKKILTYSKEKFNYANLIRGVEDFFLEKEKTEEEKILAYDNVYLDYNAQHQSIQYAKQSWAKKAMSVFKDSTEAQDKEIIDNTRITKDNIEQIVSSGVKPKAKFKKRDDKYIIDPSVKKSTEATPVINQDKMEIDNKDDLEATARNIKSVKRNLDHTEALASTIKTIFKNNKLLNDDQIEVVAMNIQNSIPKEQHGLLNTLLEDDKSELTSALKEQFKALDYSQKNIFSYAVSTAVNYIKDCFYYFYDSNQFSEINRAASKATDLSSKAITGNLNKSNPNNGSRKL